ncbi:MAG: hypothetical protein ACO204_00700 [Schleiferiaceae bacterium]
MDQLEQLALAWLKAKSLERDAQTRRVEIENEILKIAPADEEASQTHTTASGLKVKTQGKLNYKGNVEQVIAITRDWDVKPVKTKIELDETLLKLIRHDRPDLWRKLAPAITLKPAKTYLVVEEVSHGV